MAWTADDLVAAVRRRAQLPDEAADGAIDDADILMFADEELSLRLVPLVRSCRGDYWVTDSVPLGDGYQGTAVPIEAGVAAYRVPLRAQTSGLRDVTVIDSGGVSYPIPQIATEDVWRYQQPANGIVGSLASSAFYMEGTNLVIVPTPSDSGWSLRMRYHRSHSILVPNVQTGTTVWAGGPTLVVDNPPADWVAGPSGLVIDLPFSSPPFGMATMDLVVTAITPTSPTVSEFNVIGIYTRNLPTFEPMRVCLRGTTCVIDLPRECWPLLVSAVTSRVLDVIGDREGAKLEYALYAQEAANVTLLLTPRIEGNKIRIVDRNSLLRSQRRW